MAVSVCGDTEPEETEDEHRRGHNVGPALCVVEPFEEALEVLVARVEQGAGALGVANVLGPEGPRR